MEQLTLSPSTAPHAESARPATARWRNKRLWVLALLAFQYAIFQLLTGVQYGDAPRNLHWGLYVLEEPRFLLDAEDVYDRVDGFPPSPPSLASAGKAIGQSGPLHPWWGPLYPLLFAAVWWLTGSYTLLQLIVPLAAGGAVLLTYAFGLRYFSQRTALLAAALLALFPTYREHAPLSFVEPLSALLISGALWSFLARRTLLTALLGSLAMLGKIDMIFLYYGSIVLTAFVSRNDAERPYSLRHLVLSLAVPLLALLPWLYLAYIVSQRPTTVSGGPRLEAFLVVGPMMLEQLFTIRWYGALITLAALGAPVWLALRRRPTGERTLYRLLGIWLALGAVVLLVYSAMPGASNNPRVIIPALPPLALLVAHGLELMSRRWRQRILFYTLSLFVTIAVIGALFYQVPQARRLAQTMPVWETLRHLPRGVVMTEHYWAAVLYARQPTTWFEGDKRFQRNVLWNLDNFRRYIAKNFIRYIVLPGEPASSDEPPTSPEVRAYLEQTYPRKDVGKFVLFTLEPDS